MRVLVVEDDKQLCEVFHDYLVEIGHDPFVAHTAEAARLLLREVRPSAILLDVRLPGMSGLDFLRLPDIRDPDIPVVVMSGNLSNDELNDFLALGAVDYVAKPLVLDHLRDILLCLEPLAEPAAVEVGRRAHERRAAPRARVALPVRVAEYGGNGWDAMTVDLSTSGIKIRTTGAVAPSSVAKMSFALDESQSAMQVVSVLVRADVDGYAFQFMNLADWQEQRLRAFVESRLEAPPAGDLHERVLRSLTHAFSGELELDETLRLALHALTRVTGHEVSILHLLSADRGTLLLRGERGLSARLREASHLLRTGEGIVGGVAVGGQTQRVDHLAALDAVPCAADAIFVDAGLRGFVCVPLQARGRVLGTLSLGRLTRGSFTDAEVALVQIAANQLALAIDNARLHAETRQQLENMRQAQAQAAEGERLSTVSKLTAGIVHEINNPLTVVLSQASMLLHEVEGSPKSHERVRSIIDEGSRAARLLTSLLRLSRPRRAQRRECALDAEVRSVMKLTEPGRDMADIRTVMDLGDVPQVWGDPDEIRQVLLNLVQNAQQAMAAHPGERVLTVRTRVANDRILVEVLDTGPGIDAEALPRIFDAFFTTKPASEGTGLGLWISYDIAEQHGGRLHAENRPDGGAVFTLELPQRRER